MLNKTLQLGIAAVLATSGVASTLDIQDPRAVVEAVDQDSEKVIEVLTLEDAIDYGLKNDFNLLELDYALKSIESGQTGLENNYIDLRDEIRRLDNTIKDLNDQINKVNDEIKKIDEALKNLDEEVETASNGTDDSGSNGNGGNEKPPTKEELEVIKNQLVAQKGMLEEQKKVLDAQLQNLRQTRRDVLNKIDELKTEKIILPYSQEQLKESIKLTITSQFTGLLMVEEQFQLLEKTIATQEKQFAHMKRQFELGIISRADYDRAKRELTKLESQLAQVEKQFINDMAVFTLNIGIDYHPGLTLEKPKLIDQPKLVKQTKSTEKLIEESYNMKTALENLNLARQKRDRVYADGHAAKYEKEQADIDVELKLLNISKLKVDGEKAIVELYHNVEKQYHALKDAEKEVEYAKEDFKNMKKRYDIGVISRADYELSEMNVTQALFNYEMEKYNYYLLLQQVNLLEAGVLPLQS